MSIKYRRIVATFLFFAILVSALPKTVFAEDGATTQVIETSILEEMPESETCEPEEEPETTASEQLESENVEAVLETENVESTTSIKETEPDEENEMKDEEPPAEPSESVVSETTVQSEETGATRSGSIITVQVAGGASLQSGNWVWTPQTNAAGHRYVFGISYSSSGIGELAAGELNIWIPKTILIDRDGAQADTVEFSIPSEAEIENYATDEEQNQVDFVWKEEGEKYHIYNYNPISAAENGYIEVAYVTTKKPTSYRDMEASDPFYAEYELHNADEIVTDRSEELQVYMNTQAKIKSTDKRYPVSSKTWKDEWGPAPDDADEYTYLVWEIRTVIKDATQPYTITLTDEIINSTGGAEVVGYRMAGASVYSDINYAVNKTATGYRYDYVLTKQPKSNYENLTTWFVQNKITATITPEDGLDAETSATSQREFVWQKPTFTIPTGHFNVYKRGDGAFRSNQNDPLLTAPGLTAAEYTRYDLEKFIDGTYEKYNNFDYAVKFKAYPYPWTLAEGADPGDPNNYGVVPVKYVLTDDLVKLRDNSGNEQVLYAGDYQIDKLTYTFTIKDAQLDPDILTFLSIYPHYTENDIIKFYGKFGNDDTWKLVASINLQTNTLWRDSEFVRAMTTTDIYFQDNCIAYQIEAENAHYFTEICAVPNISLYNTSSVLNFIGDKETISVYNSAEGSVYTEAGDLIVTASEADSDYARKTQRDSYLEKKVVSSTNIPRTKSYVITWRIKQTEIVTFGDGTREYATQQCGVFYDLLPKGCTLDPNSVSIKGRYRYLNDSEYEIEQITNYKGSGRTLVIVRVNSRDSYYELYLDTIHPWESIKDHGSDVYNPVAYETGNNDIAQGYPDNGGEKDLEDRYDWNDEDFFQDQEFTYYFADLDPYTDDNRFIYAEEYFDIQAITTSAAGLTKRVMGIGDTKYSYDAWTTINQDYQYRLRYMNTYTTVSKELVFYDSLENYTADGLSSDWHGKLQSIDVSQLTEKGIAPVIYISYIDNLDLEGETNFLPNNDLSNADVWSAWDSTSSLANAKAVAIDMSLKADGSQFVLNPGESVVATLYFKAPAESSSANTYPETYNNVYIFNRLISETGTEIPFFIHQDYTTVRFIVTADVNLRKVSAENENLTIPGIKFKISGTSDYGNDVLEIKETDVNGQIKFENLEKGSYILQEYETNDDWLFDGTEYHVVVRGDGSVTVNDAILGDSGFVISNTPRIHGDVKIQKQSEDISRTWSALQDNLESSAAQAEPYTTYEIGIPDTLFKLSGISFYGTEVMMLETTNSAGRITFRNVEKGMYTLEEMAPNPHYIQNKTKWVVKIDDDGSASVLEPDENDRDRLYYVGRNGQYFTIENENRAWNLKLYKVDAVNNTIFLEGAEYALVGTSDLGTSYSCTAVTNVQGYLCFQNIEKGTYIIKETCAPTGVDENGQLGGNRNYILDPNPHILHITETGIVTIDGAILTETQELAMTDNRAMDGTITITKVWNDYAADDSQRPIPKLHLSTEEIETNRYVYVNVIWSGSGDTAETRPSSIKLYIGTADGTIVAEKTVTLTNPTNPTVVKMAALLAPGENYYVWSEDARGYEALNKITNKAPMEVTASRTIGTVEFRKYPPTIFVAGSTFKTLVPRSITSFTRADALPDDSYTLTTLSTGTSGLPIYGWQDGTNYYWYSAAETVYTNPNSKEMFASCTNLTSIDFSDIDTGKTTNMSFMFQDCGITSLDVSGFDVSKVTTCESMFSGAKITSINIGTWNAPVLANITSMFSGCTQLNSINMSGLSAPNVVSLKSLFYNCSKLQSVSFDNVELGPVNSLSYTFYNCKLLSSLDLDQLTVAERVNLEYAFYYNSQLSQLNLSFLQGHKVTTFNHTFSYCAKLEYLDLRNIDTGVCTSLYYTFASCSALAKIDGIETIDTKNVTNARQLFSNTALTSLDLNAWNTTKLSNIREMFYSCRSLKELNIETWDTTRLTSMESVFGTCSVLVSLDLSGWNTSNVTNMKRMFNNCGKLKYIYVSELWNVDNVTESTFMFHDCRSLPGYLNNEIYWDKSKAYYGEGGYLTYKTPPTHTTENNDFTASEEQHIDIYQLDHIRKHEGIDLYHTEVGSETEEIDFEENVSMNEEPIFCDAGRAQVDNYMKRNNPLSQALRNATNHIFTDGNYEYVSDDNNWVRTGNTWMYVFEVFDDSIPYYLTEEPIDGYSSEAMDTYIIVNENGAVTKMATIENTAETQVGALSITKTVTGISTLQRFKFEVTLTGPQITGTQIFSDIIFTNGEATVYLSDGEIVTINDIPAGTLYAVTEDTPVNYIAESENISGEIQENTTSNANVVNVYTPPEREKADIVLTKSVEGQTDENKRYYFVAQFENLSANETYTTSSQVSFTADASGLAIVPLYLAANESVQFIGIPVGATYVITESAGDYVSAYQITDANNIANIVSSANENQGEETALSTAKETVDENEAITVTFINTFNHKSNLTLKKEIVSPYLDSDTLFEFTVTLSDLPSGTKMNSDVGRFVADDDGMAMKSFTVHAGESITIEGIPVGAHYQVTEGQSKYIASYEIEEYNEDDSAIVAANKNAVQDRSLSTELGEMQDGKDTRVVFTNSFVRPGTISVFKHDSDGNALSGIPIRLEYSVDNGETWLPIISSSEPDNGYYPNGYCDTQGVEDGILYTDTNGCVVFTGLSTEATTQYRLSEMATVNSKVLMASPVLVVLPETKSFESLEEFSEYVETLVNSASEIDYEISEEDMTVTIYHVYYNFVNHSTFEIPKTGEAGYRPLPYAIALEMIVIAVAMQNRKKKKQKQT